MPTTIQTSFDLPEKFQALFWPGYRYRVFYGGRGGAKSISFARALLARAFTEKLLILCAREFQNSIQDSVLRTLATQIHELGLSQWFDIQRTTVICKTTGSEFIFKGLHNNIGEIKSMSGVNIAWVEEGSSMSEESFLILDPTLRNNSELWISFNPSEATDPVYARFVTTRPPNAIVVPVGYQDNPWFPKELETLRQYMRDQPDYRWIWEGDCRENAEAAVYHGKVMVRTFDEAPDKTRFYHGLDFGFAADPSVLVRCWIAPSIDGFGEDLMIDREAYAHGIEIDEMGDWMDRCVETARFWPIKADNARPETISYLSRHGFSIMAAEKWPGIVEDSISHLRSFRHIIIHERLCPNTAREFRTYRYKVDKSGAILPLIDEHNDHAPDATRYALDGFIQKRGGIGVWQRLVKPNR